MEFNSELYFITDSTGYELEEFLARVEDALKGGVTMLQLREKQKTTRAYMELAGKVHQICRDYKVPLIIDDRVDVMLAIGAEGVHLGAEDMPLWIARKLIGPDKILGATAKTVEAAKSAYEAGADYLGVGAIFPTTTKVKTVLTSLETLDAICKAVPIPVNAIGGLHAENLDVLNGIDIAGVCAVSGIMHAESPRKAAEKMRKRFRGLKNETSEYFEIGNHGNVCSNWRSNFTDSSYRRYVSDGASY
ncbi:MAG: thiamine phosphate synthase [Lachnospiraceae bacterium]|nr:thiamine phosphate synthase [Lachnospiraceae bacterium]